jgi:hypothetical protein
MPRYLLRVTGYLRARIDLMFVPKSPRAQAEFLEESEPPHHGLPH